MSVSKLMKDAKKLLQRGSEYSMSFDVHSGSILPEISRKIPTTIGMPLQVHLYYILPHTSTRLRAGVDQDADCGAGAWSSDR